MSVQPLQPWLVQAGLAWLALHARLAQLTACQLVALTAMRSQPVQPWLVQTHLAQLTTCQLAELTATRWQPVQPWLVQSRLAWQALRVRIAQLAV